MPSYKYTHNVNEGKGCIFFQKKEYRIYTTKQLQKEAPLEKRCGRESSGQEKSLCLFLSSDILSDKDDYGNTN